MNRFRNFPASTDMTQFEIVELQNEMLRQREIEERDEEEKTSLSSDSDDETTSLGREPSLPSWSNKFLCSESNHDDIFHFSLFINEE